MSPLNEAEQARILAALQDEKKEAKKAKKDSEDTKRGQRRGRDHPYSGIRVEVFKE